MAYVAMAFLRAAIKESQISKDAKATAFRETLIPAYFCVGNTVTRLHYFFGKGTACCCCAVGAVLQCCGCAKVVRRCRVTIVLVHGQPRCVLRRCRCNVVGCLSSDQKICCQKHDAVLFQSGAAMRAYFAGVGDAIAHSAASLHGVTTAAARIVRNRGAGDRITTTKKSSGV
jgi:hypothetical protein